MSLMKRYRVSIPVLIAEESADDPRIVSDAENKPSGHLALMVGFHIKAPTARDAALILYERLEGTCSDT
jgi:hypothetical protein